MHLKLLEMDMRRRNSELNAAMYSSNDMSRIAGLMKIEYRQPSGGFDRNKVKGRVISLFEIVNKTYNKAIEIIGGRQLYSVVVDDKNTSNKLLKEKWFNCFMSFIPLRDLMFRPMDKNIIARIEKRYKEKAIHAIKALKYDQYVERAINFIFGSYFICENSTIAKEIIKSENNTQCVTLDGDIYRSSGVISGGYNDFSSRNIEFVSIYKSKLSKINTIQFKIKEILSELEGLKNEQRKLIELEATLVEKEDELNQISLDPTQEKRSIKNM